VWESESEMRLASRWGQGSPWGTARERAGVWEYGRGWEQRSACLPHTRRSVQPESLPELTALSVASLLLPLLSIFRPLNLNGCPAPGFGCVHCSRPAERVEAYHEGRGYCIFARRCWQGQVTAGQGQAAPLFGQA